MLLIVDGYKTCHLSAIDDKKNLSDTRRKEAVISYLHADDCKWIEDRRLLGKEIEGVYFTIWYALPTK